MTIAIKPQLNNCIKSAEFRNYYWKKAELINFCKENGLPTSGSKFDLEILITEYIDTGLCKESASKTRASILKDSDNQLTVDTPVINYKNDAITREFFVKHIGAKFKFNAYLREFAKQTNLSVGITYGKLITGWLDYENKIKSSKQKPAIAKQFQFNQFQRDFYAQEIGKTRQEFLEAWELVKSAPGPATYKHYLTLLKGEHSE
jgi:hypothetical protein